jgi:hypothetical protein
LSIESGTVSLASHPGLGINGGLILFFPLSLLTVVSPPPFRPLERVSILACIAMSFMSLAHSVRPICLENQLFVLCRHEAHELVWGEAPAVEVLQLDLVNVREEGLVRRHLVPFEQVDQEIFRRPSSRAECIDATLYVLVEHVYVTANSGHVFVELAELGAYDRRCLSRWLSQMMTQRTSTPDPFLPTMKSSCQSSVAFLASLVSEAIKH